jgi:DNA polymerase-2
MVYKGLETVRSDWTPLARQFQQEFYRRIFQRQPPTRTMCATTWRAPCAANSTMLAWSTASDCAAPSDDYERNVPPHVRAARTADAYNLAQEPAACSTRTAAGSAT